MEIKYKQFLSENFFPLLLLLAVIVVVFLSYDRFIIRRDYIVGYEGVCDPVVNSCFVGCEDDLCTSEYYYTKMQKYEPDLFLECGSNITECEAANACLPTDRKCSIVYCNPDVDGPVCTEIPSKLNTQTNNTQNTNI